MISDDDKKRLLSDPMRTWSNLNVEQSNRYSIQAASRLYSLGRFSDAVAVCERILEDRPGSHEALYISAMAWRQLRDIERAIQLATRAVELKPDFGQAHVALASFYHACGQLALAEQHIQKGAELVPDYVECPMTLATIYEEQRDWEQAEQVLRRAMEQFPSNPRFPNRLGELLGRRSRIREGEALFRHALSLKPDYASAHFNLNWYGHGIPSDTDVAELERLLNRPDLSQQDTIFLRLSLGYVLDRIGDYCAAFRSIKEANDIMCAQTSYDIVGHRQFLREIRETYEGLPVFQASAESTQRHVPIFIVGTSRSGKTLLETLILRQAGILALGEAKQLERSKTEFAGQYGLEGAAPSAIKELGCDRLREIGAAYIEKIAGIDPDAAFSVATQPGGYKNVGIMLDALPQSKVIFCRRNALDSCLKMYFKFYGRNHAYSYDLTLLAQYYRDYWDLMSFWKERYGERILEVDYEDLVKDHRSVLSRVFDYVGLKGVSTDVDIELTADEIGHWRHYEEELAPLRAILDQPNPLTRISVST